MGNDHTENPNQYHGIQDDQTGRGRAVVGMLSANRQPYRAEADQRHHRRQQREPR
jgi:hypothetical protein